MILTQANYLKSLFTFLCLIYLSGMTWSQTEAAKTVEIDFGKIKKKNEDVADVAITNNTDELVYLLNYQAERPVRFLASQPFIEAGRTAVYRIKLNPAEKGEIEKELQLFFSHRNQPFVFELKGEVIEVPVNDLQKCPSFRDLPSSRELARNRRRANGRIQEFAFDLEVIEAPNQSSLKAEVLEEEKVDEQEIKELNERQEDTDRRGAVDPGIDERQQSELLGNEYKANNLIFLIDASSSMEEQERFELLKLSLEELLKPLRSIDYLSMISYAGEAEMLLDPTSSVEKEKIRRQIKNLKSGGSTNAVKGIDLALETAHSSFIEGGNNQIYLVTDGAFSIGRYNERSRNAIREAAKKGIYISALAVRSARQSRQSLKEIVDLGEGKFIRIEGENDKNRILEAVKKSALN